MSNSTKEIIDNIFDELVALGEALGLEVLIG